MTGREKIEAALSADGSPAFAAVTNYQGIFLRDHWEQATDQPWWAQFDSDPQRAAQPWFDMIRRTDEDWFTLRFGHNRQDQQDLTIEAEGDRAWQVNRHSGERRELTRPPISGAQPRPSRESIPPGHDIRTPEQLEALLGPAAGPDSDDTAVAIRPLPDDGTLDLPRLLVNELGQDRMPITHVGAPWWLCYGLWGFDDLMMRMVDTPELVHLACEHYLGLSLHTMRREAAVGARLIWIEDCMSDMISPAQFRDFALPYVRRLTEAAREAGLHTVYYFCGRPHDRWDLLLDSGADALSLEESKKTFDIDIMQVAQIVQGRMALLGNIDAIGIMEQGSEAALQAEIARQCEAGRLNRHRFFVSLGSPVTPDTPLTRVRRYCDLVHSIRTAGVSPA